MEESSSENEKVDSRKFTSQSVLKVGSPINHFQKALTLEPHLHFPREAVGCATDSQLAEEVHSDAESRSADQSSGQSDMESDSEPHDESKGNDDPSVAESESRSAAAPSSGHSDDDSDSEWDDIIDRYDVKRRGQSDDDESADESEDEPSASVYEEESLAGLGSFLQRNIRTYLTAGERTGFMLLLACLQECLLTHRWKEASQALEILCLYPSHHLDDYVWKCGMEVLYKHPDSDPAMIQHFTRKMEGINVQRKRKRLEKAFYLLSQGDIRNAEVEIQSARIRGRGAIKKREAGIHRYWLSMIQAYSGMLKYMDWLQGHMASQSRDSLTEHRQADSTDYIAQGACEGLSSVTGKPGVWDIFVTKQAHILETTGKIEETKELLEKYCASCEDNPNAHRYLYRFLKRNSADRQEMIRVLKEYVKRIPSDLLALDLIRLLQQTAKPHDPDYRDDICLMTNTLFDMLDYPCWYERLPPWKALAKHLTKILKRRDAVAIDAVKACWGSRQWWPSYHFDAKAAQGLLKSKRKVVIQKAVVAMIMHTVDSPFVTCVRKYFTKKQDKASLKQLDKASKLAKDSLKLGVRCR